jgi:hypothetical protein
MNEQIREFMLLAGTDTSGKWMGVEHVERLAELIVRECIAQCEQVATAADAKSKSKFVTDDGRMLHEGMWGGAKNCSVQIKQHFGVEL